MSLKVNGLFLLLGGVLGGYSVYRLMPPSIPQVITKTVTLTDIKTKIVKVTQPNGTIIERTEQVLVERKKEDQKAVINNYALGVKREYDFKSQKDLYELEIYRHASSGFYLGFSINSGNQIGIGILKTF